jgi:hypothetical protein
MSCIEAMGPVTGPGYVMVGGQLAHRAAWEAAHGEIPSGLFVLHSCDNRRCVNVEHLRLGTHADNMSDRNQRGRTARGDRHGKAKLTDAQVREVLASPERGVDVARRLGVSKSLVSLIRAGKRREVTP